MPGCRGASSGGRGGGGTVSDRIRGLGVSGRGGGGGGGPIPYGGGVATRNTGPYIYIVLYTYSMCIYIYTRAFEVSSPDQIGEALADVLPGRAGAAPGGCTAPGVAYPGLRLRARGGAWGPRGIDEPKDSRKPSCRWVWRKMERELCGG